jgi:hypothetical protein
MSGDRLVSSGRSSEKGRGGSIPHRKNFFGPQRHLRFTLRGLPTEALEARHQGASTVEQPGSFSVSDWNPVLAP